MANLTVTLTESVTLNGSVRGSTNQLTITSINNTYERIVTCTAGQVTFLAEFSTNAHHASGIRTDLEDVRYIRVTNLASSNVVELSIVGDTTLYQIELGAGESHILGNSSAVMLAEADTTPSFGTMRDLSNIQVKPTGSDTDIEIFIASA